MAAITLNWQEGFVLLLVAGAITVSLVCLGALAVNIITERNWGKK